MKIRKAQSVFVPEVIRTDPCQIFTSGFSFFSLSWKLFSGNDDTARSAVSTAGKLNAQTIFSGRINQFHPCSCIWNDFKLLFRRVRKENNVVCRRIPKFIIELFLALVLCDFKTLPVYDDGGSEKIFTDEAEVDLCSFGGGYDAVFNTSILLE